MASVLVFHNFLKSRQALPAAENLATACCFETVTYSHQDDISKNRHKILNIK